VQLTAEVAVKRASMKAADLHEALAWGIQSSRVPSNIVAAKPAMKTTKKGGFWGRYSERKGPSCGCFLSEVAFFIFDDGLLEERLGEGDFSGDEILPLELGVEFSFACVSLRPVLCQCKRASFSLARGE